MSQALTTVEHEINALAPQFTALLPADVSPEKFREVALAAIRRMPALLNCERQSLFNAVLAAAQDGLMPDGREGAIVPRKGKANWQPMIAGIYKKVKTSGSVATISANVVYEGEPFDVLLGDDERIVHRRDMAMVADGNEAAVYAIAVLKDGTREREVMTWDQVMTVRQTSSTPNDGPWVTSPGEMARKTVVRRLAKRLPVLDQADEALHRTIGRVDSLYAFGTPAPEAPQPPSSPRDALNAQIPLKPTRRAGTWRSAEGEDADRAEAAERQRAAAAATTRADRVQDMSTTYDTADDPAGDGNVCPKCQGTGEWRLGKKCFACNGTGNTAKRPIVTGKDTAPPPERTREAWVAFINGLIQACEKQTDRAGIEAIAARPSVGKALAEAPPWAKDEIENVIGDFMAKLPAAEPGDDLDDVVIAGEDKILAG